MTVTVNGTLTIKIINGRNGDFAVGDLTTSIGQFAVKDAVLEQFAAGTYTGQFVIEEIYPWSYSTRGRSVIEVRARLADLLIDEEGDANETERDAEPDPADERPFGMTSEAAPAPAQDLLQSPDPVPAPTSAEGANHSDGEVPPGLIDLFGEELAGAIADRGAVKLDSTADRLRFRAQRDRLKAELDYGFVPDDQTWYPKESEIYLSYLERRGSSR